MIVVLGPGLQKKHDLFAWSETFSQLLLKVGSCPNDDSFVQILFWPFLCSFLGGWSGGAMVLGKLPVPGRPTIWMIVGQGPIALALGAGGVVWTFLLYSILSPVSPSLWETRYRLKYCLKGSLNPKQPTNQLCSF